MEFYNGLKQTTESQIDFNAVLDHWTGKTDYLSHAIIIIDGIKINCRYFFRTQIENDFDPQEINFITAHEIILKYMTGVSSLLRKNVVMTPENLPNQSYISISMV